MNNAKVLTLLLLTGCAGVDYGRVPYTPVPAAKPGSTEAADPAVVLAKKKNAAADQDAQGIRYYDTSPYLLVFSDGKGSIKWKIAYLPDQTKKRTIEPTALLASVNSTHNFTNGMLTSGNVAADATALPKAVISALQGVLTSSVAAGLLDVPSGGYAVPPPQVYKIMIIDGVIELHGGAGDVPVRVTLK